MRHKMYSFFGFQNCEEVDIGIVNPDCPVNNYFIDIDGVRYVPYLEMPTTGSTLCEHAMMYDIDSQKCVKARDTKIFDIIGKTTTYVIHPEEICADFFMNLFVEGKNADKDKLSLFKQELMRCLSA